MALSQPDEADQLPAHILLVHAVVVLLPLAALLLVLTAVFPAVRGRLAAPNALLSLFVVIVVPITTDAGEWLERRVPRSELLHQHTELGDTALFAALPVAVLAAIIWWRHREAVRAATDVGTGPAQGGDGTATRVQRRTFLAPLSTTVTTVVIVLAVAAAGSAAYDIYRIGDSGAKATWDGKVSPTPAPRGPGGD